MAFTNKIRDYISLKLMSCLIPLIFQQVYVDSRKGCYHPGIPINGDLFPDQVEYVEDDELTFTCHQSYVLIGEQRIQCIGNNSWSNQVPFCEKNTAFGIIPQYLKEEDKMNGKHLRLVMDGDPHTCDKVTVDKELKLTIWLQQEQNISQILVYVKNFSEIEVMPDVTVQLNNGFPDGNFEAVCYLTHEGNEVEIIVFECNVEQDPFPTEIVQVVFRTEKKIDMLLCDITSFSMGGITVRCDQRKEFDCGRSHCIPFSKVCDGIRNCWDGKDESKEKCERSPSLLLTTLTDIRMKDIETGNERIVVRHQARATDYLFRTGTLIWINRKTRHISSSLIDEGEPVTAVIVQDIIEPLYISVDWIYSHIYWIDGGKKTIEVTNLIGNMRKVLISNIEKPSSIALNPLEGWMFWSNCEKENVIERCVMDGTNWKKIIKSGGCPKDITIDLLQSRIYWTEGLTNIKSNNFDGSEQTISIELLRDSRNVHFQLYQNWIYWSNAYEAVIHKTERGSNKTELNVFTNITYSYLRDINVYHPLKQPAGINYCGEDNGNCSHFCFPSPKIADRSFRYVCSCPNGFILDDDEITCISSREPRTQCDLSKEFDCGTLLSSRCIPITQVCDGISQCHDGKDEFQCGSSKLIYTSDEDVRWIDIKSEKEEEIIINDHSAGFSTDYLFNAGIIFWTDVKGGIIKSAPVKYGSPVTNNIMDDILVLSEIALDWIYNHIYWTDFYKGTVEIADLFGYKRKVLIEEDIEKPRAIALNPMDGWLFWSDVGKSPKIERCGMDGTHRQIINTKNDYVTSLTIDFDERRIYWNDVNFHTISSANFDGTNRKLVLSHRTQWIASIAVYKDWIYWLDPHSGVYKSNKHYSRNSIEVVKKRNTTLRNIKIFDSSKQKPGKNYCGSDNGNCHHFCLPSPRINDRSPQFTCSSPATYSLGNDSGSFLEGCDPPTLPMNTKIIPVREIYFHSQHVKIICDEGFTLFGSNTKICHNGDWNDAISFCDKNIFYNQNITIWKRDIQFIPYEKNFTDGNPSTCVTENVSSRTTFVINLQGIFLIQNITVIMQFQNRNIMEDNLRMIFEVSNLSSVAEYTLCNSSTKAKWTDNKVELTCGGNPMAGQLIKMTFISIGHLSVNVQLCDLNVFTVNPVIHHNSKVICRFLNRSPNCKMNEFIDFTGNQYISYSAQIGYHLKGRSLLKCENGRWNDDPPQCHSDYSPNSTVDQSYLTATQPDNYKTPFILMSTTLAISLFAFLLYKIYIKRMQEDNCDVFRRGKRNSTGNPIDSMSQLIRNTNETIEENCRE